MVPDRTNARRRAVLATAGAGLSGLAGCNFGYLGDTTPGRPPLWGESVRIGVLAASNIAHGRAIEHGARMVGERIDADGGASGVPVVQQWQADGEGGGERVAIEPPRGPTAAYQRPPWLS